MKKILLVFFLFLTANSFAQNQFYTVPTDPEKNYRERQVDMLSMRLIVDFKTDSGIVNGEVTHLFTSLRSKVDSLFFDAPGIQFSKVSHNGKPLQYKTNEKGVTVFFAKPIQWNSKDSVTFIYTAKPKKGIYFIGWNDPSNRSRKQIWTQGQGIDNRHWIPCYDDTNDKLITEVIVKFKSEYKVLSNGTKLKEKDNGDGTKTWHYKMKHPHSVYLLMLGIGVYDVKEIKAASGVPIRLWYYPEKADRVEPTYRYSKEMFDYFEKEIGVPYAWESYSQIPVQDFMYGAMENTTATVFGDFFLNDARGAIDRGYVGVNAHELAHQWFGDLITARSDPHHWLQESFATHYNMLFEGQAFGIDYYDWSRRNAYNSSIEASKKDKYPVAHSQGGSPRHYQKGASVLHMIKYVVGREGYNRGVANYLKKNAYGNVDTHDLMNAIEDATGQPLGWFFDQWVYKGGEPSYEVSFSERIAANQQKSAVFFVKQVQELNDQVGLFKMPFEFEIHFDDGSMMSKREWVDKAANEIVIELPAGKKIAYALFDPNSNVLKTVQFEKSTEMLMEQAKKAKYMIDRYDAWVALQRVPLNQKKDFMINAFKTEKYYPIKSEILKQSLQSSGSEFFEMHKAAINDQWPDVRKTMINNAVNPMADLIPEFEKMLNDSSYDVVASALEKLIIWNPLKAKEYLEKTKGVEGSRAKIVATKWHELNFALNNDVKSMEVLQDYTSVSFEFQTRTGAFNALKRIGVINDAIIANALSASISANNRLSGPAADYLRYFNAQLKYKSQIKTVFQKGKWNAAETQSIQKIIQE
jgi:aminopeptidase N